MYLGASDHGVAGVDVFPHGFFQESGRGNDPDPARPDLRGGDHPFYAGPVIGVAVGIDDGQDGPPAQVGVDQLHGRSRRIDRGEGVDDDITRGACDDPQIGQVVAPHLVDALRHLEKAVAVVEERLAPQAGVDGLQRSGPVQEGIPVHIPNDLVGFVADRGGFPRGDPAPVGSGEILLIREGQLPEEGAVGLQGRLRSLPGLRGANRNRHQQHQGDQNQGGQRRGCFCLLHKVPRKCRNDRDANPLVWICCRFPPAGLFSGFSRSTRVMPLPGPLSVRPRLP